MIYEVKATMFFDEENEAKDFAHDCDVALAKAIVVKPGQPDQECSSWDLLHCNHDQTPPIPCELTDHSDNCPVED